MGIADAVEAGADCLGSKVGAVVVVENRVVSTGYNGTPSGFTNCEEGGCVRCHDSWLFKQGRQEEMSDPDHVSGAALDRCICVHAEQNAFITAARFGIRLDGATLYTTQSPCFTCLKEAIQAGVRRIVYKTWYQAKYSPPLIAQYRELCAMITKGDPTKFEPLGAVDAPVEEQGQPDPLEDEVEGVPLAPPTETS